MSDRHEIICIQCPMACRIELYTGDDGTIEKVTGFQCKEGKSYAPQEYQSPQRVLTSTVRTKGSKRPVLPVRSREPIPRSMIFECMEHIDNIIVQPPLKMGDVIVKDIMGTGIDILCTDDLSA